MAKSTDKIEYYAIAERDFSGLEAGEKCLVNPNKMWYYKTNKMR